MKIIAIILMLVATPLYATEPAFIYNETPYTCSEVDTLAKMLKNEMKKKTVEWLKRGCNKKSKEEGSFCLMALGRATLPSLKAGNLSRFKESECKN